MRKKELKTVITFKSTTSAMAMEKVCKDNNATGRLIPIPLQISAGCGLAWSAYPQYKNDLLLLMITHKINYDGIYEIEI